MAHDAGKGVKVVDLDESTNGDVEEGQEVGEVAAVGKRTSEARPVTARLVPA